MLYVTMAEIEVDAVMQPEQQEMPSTSTFADWIDVGAGITSESMYQMSFSESGRGRFDADVIRWQKWSTVGIA